SPLPMVAFYGSFSMSYVPRAGEQLASLSLDTATLEPETFTNYEAGAKWDVLPSLSMTAALYRLDRGNIAVADPVNTGQLMLVDGQRTEGVEIGMSGRIARRWSAIGQYTYMDARITESLSSSTTAGARLAHVPEHSISLWNRFDFSDRLGIGAGAIHQTESFASTDNSVVLPGFTRLDAAVFFDVTDRVQAQLNVENLTGIDYYAYAHNNNNITPGSPRSVRLSWSTRF
ncbi:MAG TPA: TonB-dependent receptor, partial [Thermoanaerobaculia bacterium]|nr:TonB-dependent receptor [Thermoanaerobaculia bacterium]